MSVYETLCEIITNICFILAVPVTLAQFSTFLDGLVQEELLDYTCQIMVEEGKLVKISDAFTLSSLSRRCRQNLLISSEYQQLGMKVVKTDQNDYVRMIPFDAEHRFFETLPSTIGREAGFGLFVRQTRRIPQGCIMCEYRGITLETPPLNTSYVVRVRATNRYIDGISLTHEHQSLASFINDNGPQLANTGMMEFDRYPGRVFMVALRDIEPGEELFCLYGATYWGFESYADVNQLAEKTDSRDARLRILNRLELTRKCPVCGREVLRRGMMLHQKACQDELVEKRLRHLDCMPYSEFTAAPNVSQVVPSNRFKGMRKAISLVDRKEPLTFSHSYEDVIGDYEFSFEDLQK